MEHTDILLIQEHWCHEADINRIVDNMDNVQITGVSGMDSNVLLSGRPYRGCAFLFDVLFLMYICHVIQPIIIRM